MKTILLVITFFFIFQLTHAQVYVGASSGLSITKLKTDPTYFEYSSLARCNANIHVLYKLNKNIGFESGISYINMGSKQTYYVGPYTSNDDKIYTKSTLRLNYISAPVTFNFYLPVNKFSIYAKAGGYVSYLLNVNIKNDETKEKSNRNLKNDDLNAVDIGILAAMGITRTLGNGFIFMDARYMIGCANLNNTDNVYLRYLMSANAFNRSFILNVGYMFNLGKS